VALKGKVGFSEVFFSANGIKMLVFIGTGVLTGISFPWSVLGGTWVLFAASILYTVSRKRYPKIASKLKKFIKNKK